MTGAYVAGFVKTALALNARNPLGLLAKARTLLARGNTALRARVGARQVDSAVDAGREFMRARGVMLPMAAVPLVTTT